MGRRPGRRGGLDADQAAALRDLVEASGAERGTGTAIQAAELAGQDMTPTATPAQASLLVEAS
jgi:hypothetical protein